MRAVIDTLCDGIDLSQTESEALFRSMLEGTFVDVEVSALLVALKGKGEAPEEIAGAVRALCAAATPFPRPDYLFADCCGTGGDGLGTINISTAAGLVAAAAGLPIAKHGNRSVSSRCGSADVLESLGVRLDPTPSTARRALDDVGFTFLFAPRYHGGLKHVMNVRRTLKVRTIMNLLGPLVNPSAPPVQLLGVYDPSRVLDTARTLRLLGCRSALVVHGGGLDEIALHAPTHAARLQDGVIEEMTLTPEDAGLARVPISALAGGGPQANAGWLERLLAGKGEREHRHAVAINAGALLWIAGRAGDLRQGTEQALDILASDRAYVVLSRFIAASQEEVARG